MKKSKLILLVPLMLLGIINPVKSQTQSEIWSLGDKTYSFDQLNPLGNLPLGNANTLLAENNGLFGGQLSVAQSHVYYGQKPFYSQNVAHDENGHVVFFVIDGNVYDHEGVLLARGIYNSTANANILSFPLPEGNSETVIVPVPGKCNSYYVIASSTSSLVGGSGGNQFFSKLHYYEVDFNQPHSEYLNRNGLVTYIDEIDFRGFEDQVYSFCSSTHLAVSKTINDFEERYLFISQCSGLFTAKIKNNEISIEIDHPRLVDGLDYTSSNRNEMEVVKLNDKYIVARETGYDINWVENDPNVNYVDFIEIRELDENGQGAFPSTDGRRIFYLSFSLDGLASYTITGIEITPTGNHVYVTTKEAPYLWVRNINPLSISIASNSGAGNIQYYELDPVFPLITVDSDYEGSQIEYASDGKLYMYSGKNNLISIENWDIPFGQITNTVNLNLNNPASQGSDPLTSLHLLNDQVDGENYSAFHAITPECCSDGIVYDISELKNNTEITSNTTWNALSSPWGNATRYVADDLIIKSGAKLTLNGITLQFSRKAKLIVEQGAALIMKNSTLTSVECEGIMWPGVEVWGTQGVAHSTQFNSAYGSIIMTNNSVISNAVNGITTASRDENDNYDLFKSGGYINANSSNFIDNRIDIDLPPHFFAGSIFTQATQITKTIFKNCTFKTTRQLLKNDGSPDTHVKLTQVRGVNFYNNLFINTAVVDESADYYLGSGINSVDSKFNLPFSCSSLQQLGIPCPEEDKIGNRFENLFYGIKASAANPINNFTVEYAEFINNHRGITMSGIVGANIDKNHFEVANENSGINSFSHGIYMAGCSKYFCENNYFTTNHNGEYGIITVNGGDANAKIRNNIFTNLKYGTTATGDNFHVTNDGTEIGLQYLCNEFFNTDYVDVQVTPGNATAPGIHNGQGFCNEFDQEISIHLQPANNIFTIPPPDALHFTFSSQINHPTYYHHSAINNSTFDIIPDNSPSVFNNTDCQNATFPLLKSEVCPESEYSTLSTGHLFLRIGSSKTNIVSLFNLIDANNKQGLLNAMLTLSAGDLKDLLLAASPYLSDEVLLAYIALNPPAGHLKDVMLANSSLSQTVQNALINVAMPNGIRNQISAAQNGESPMQDLKNQISSITFQKDGFSDELFRRYLNDTLQNKWDSLDYLLQFDPTFENAHLRVSVKLLQSDYAGAESIIEDLRNSGNFNNTYVRLMEALVIIYECQDKAYRLKWDEPLKGEIENIAVNEQDKRECRNAGALLELLRMLEQPEVYEVVDINDARRFSQILETETSQQFKIYPNPASDYLNIQTIQSNTTVFINIYDISGKLLLSSYGYNTDYILMDISALSGGLYLVEVNSDSGKIEIQKLTIER